ncbi:unnamed protein product [Phytomonas sp. Hart1]|nr:unnamed protein product [Phytomonas sp. Hart1]|eukprot:CCW71938.1 unnamed protein product [Phytomonas sp. isolate Hart1]
MNKAIIFCFILATMVCIACGDDLTRESFKKKKMKELREFLSDRNLKCVGCQEKDDFVKIAFENRDKKPVTGVEKREIPSTSFWETWGNTTKETCMEIVKKRGEDATSEPYTSVCSTLALAVESLLMQHGKNLSHKLKKRPELILKTSYTGVYYDAGKHIFQKLVDYCLTPSIRSKCSSLTFVMDIMENSKVADFKSWIMNVGIENTNPMFEVLGDHNEL